CPLALSVLQLPCHHCCDDDFLPDEAPRTLLSDTPAMPEIRMYIKMTILKGLRTQNYTLKHHSDKRIELVYTASSLPKMEGIENTVFFFSPHVHLPSLTPPSIHRPTLDHTPAATEIYVHIMQNEEACTLVYTQPVERSIMQSQSILLTLQLNDEVWVRLYKRECENAIYSNDVDIYIMFNGYLIISNTD
ncbi:complement C1q tumor necrosis factor-related protein 6-like, partial [Neoarius graeffei]|uniref:complement C1q tumor necrosis factor-related protein 6-like n=1 Tax=Neoarius graeffei TaxID=443677 RepID=UPI00298BCFDF